MADALTVAEPLAMGGPSLSVIVFIPVASRQDNSLPLFWRRSEPCPDLPVGNRMTPTGLWLRASRMRYAVRDEPCMTRLTTMAAIPASTAFACGDASMSMIGFDDWACS